MSTIGGVQSTHPAEYTEGSAAAIIALGPEGDRYTVGRGLGGAAIPGYAPDGLIACHACDGAHRLVPVPEGGKALCGRCGTLLYRNLPASLDRSAALYLAALILFLLANTFPFVALRYGDRVEQSLLISGAIALQKAGMAELGVLVLLTGVVFPFLTICGMLYLLLPLRFGFGHSGHLASPHIFLLPMRLTLTVFASIGRTT